METDKKERVLFCIFICKKTKMAMYFIVKGATPDTVRKILTKLYNPVYQGHRSTLCKFKKKTFNKFN